MIERKRGHILAVSSMCAKVSFCENVIYATTKYGNDGFMSALYEELCFRKQDKFIKLTTVYPGFVGTQKQLVDLVRSISDVPFYEPDLIGDLIVRGMLTNRREFRVPASCGVFEIIKYICVN